MTCATFIHTGSWVETLDPRGRVAMALLGTIVVAATDSAPVIMASLASVVLLAAMSGLPLRSLLARLLQVNMFLGLVGLVLIFSAPGDVVGRWWIFQVSDSGVSRALEILAKGNSAVLLFTILAGTMESFTLGRSLQQLGCPAKLVQIFLFAIRYVDLFHHEYDRLRRAMAARAFSPGANLHTWRTYGNLFGMLLVRSFDRSERVLAAMKCRGFTGEFHALQPFSIRIRDYVFIAVFCSFVSGLIGLDLLCIHHF